MSRSACSHELDRCLEVAEQDLHPTDAVQRDRLPDHVPGRPVQLERQLGVTETVRGAALELEHPRLVDANVGLAGPVAQLVEQVERVLEMDVRLVEPTERHRRHGEPAVCAGLGRALSHPLGGAERDPLGGRRVVPVPGDLQEHHQRPRQLPGVRVEALPRRPLDGREQHGVLGGEPCERLVIVGEWLRPG